MSSSGFVLTVAGLIYFYHLRRRRMLFKFMEKKLNPAPALLETWSSSVSQNSVLIVIVGPGWSGLGFHLIPLKSHQVIYFALLVSLPNSKSFIKNIIILIYY
jgi:hypothetical protein